MEIQINTGSNTWKAGHPPIAGQELRPSSSELTASSVQTGLIPAFNEIPGVGGLGEDETGTEL